MIIRNNKIKKFFILISSILLIIIILFTPLIYYTFNINYYKFLYEENGVFSVLNKNDVLTASEEIINFFKYKSDLDYKDSTLHVRYADESKSAVLSFRLDEISHLYDVRALLTRIFIIYFIAVFVFFIMLFLLIERNIKGYIYNISAIFLISSAVTIFFIIVLYLMGKNFSVLFDNFHKLFFTQGNYTFTEGSLIITLFPSGFFYDFFRRLVVSSAIISVIFLFIGLIFIVIFKLYKRYNKKVV